MRANPLVRDRLAKLRGLLDRLVARHGRPDLAIVEAVRKVGLGKKKTRDLIKRRDAQAKERAHAREDGASSKTEMRRYLLLKELGGVCPYCRSVKVPADFADGDFEIEHIVPYRRCFCDETFNLTMACRACNKEKGPARRTRRGTARRVGWKSRQAPTTFERRDTG